MVRTFGLVLVLAVAVLVAVLVGPLVFGVLYPFKPPKMTGDQAVLRVMAPPGRYYMVEWGGAGGSSGAKRAASWAR